jgi:Putative Actinobacterial Holin-X, holin superfamily III
MPTHASENGGSVGTAVKDVADHAKRVVSLELELAKLEVSRKVATLGIGIGLAVAAAVVAVYALGFGFAAGAAGLATFLPTWLALLIVMAVLFLLAGILGLVSVNRIKKGTPPVPEQAIVEAKLTTEALKSDA